MGLRPTLDELEKYGQELYHAKREGRVPRYKDPRAVFAEDPNREDGYLIELTEEELVEAERIAAQTLVDAAEVQAQVVQELADNNKITTQEAAQTIANATPTEPPVNPTGALLADPGQDLAHQLSLAQNDTHSTHQAQQVTPNPDAPLADKTVTPVPEPQTQEQLNQPPSPLISEAPAVPTTPEPSGGPEITQPTAPDQVPTNPGDVTHPTQENPNTVNGPEPTQTNPPVIPQTPESAP